MLSGDNGYSEFIMDPFYPCVKYKKTADPKLDGTDYFIVAESMHLKERMYIDFDGIVGIDYEWFHCSLSFTCENDKKAFYKLIKDCLQF